MRIIREEIVHKARIFSVAEVTLEHRGKELNHSIIRFVDTVSVLPVTREGKIILEKQFRTPVGQFLLEIPAGKIDKGETPQAAMFRELEEEIGKRPVKFRELFQALVSCGYSDEFMHYYIAEVEDIPDSERSHFADDDEEIETIEVTPEEALAMAHKGDIRDAKTIMMILAYINEHNTTSQPN